MPHAIELRLHRGDQIPHPRMAGDLQDGAMHNLVQREKLEMIAGIDGARLTFSLLSQHRDLRFGDVLGCQPDGAAFQCFADELAAGHGGKIDRRHERAYLRHDAQQAFLGQTLEYFADRGCG